MGFDSLGSAVFAVILAFILFGIVPAMVRRAIENARRHDEDRFSTSLHLVRLDKNVTRIQGAKDVTMTQQKKPQLTSQQIRTIRAERKAAIHRRQLLVTTLGILSVLLVIASYVFGFTPLFALIPLFLIIIVLYFGYKATLVAEQWEKMVRQGQSSSGSSNKSRKPQHSGTPPFKSSTSMSNSQNQNKQNANSSETAPTYVIPVDDVREVLRQQAQDKARAIAQRSKKTNSTKSNTANTSGNDYSSHNSKQKSNTSIADDKNTDNNADKFVNEKPDNSETVVLNNSPKKTSNQPSEGVSAENATTKSDDHNHQDLVSFTMGSHQETTINAVKSAEIKSYRQVANAVELPTEEQKAIFDDVSLTVTDASQVTPPQRSVDSLGVDVDAVMARRQQK